MTFCDDATNYKQSQADEVLTAKGHIAAAT